ncbi:hypothetical protein ACVWY2_006795 [Bradyrhizobium sp. JR6.1]
MIGKAIAEFAAVRIERDHAAVIDRQEDPTRAFGRRRTAAAVDGALRGLVIGDAAAGHVLERLVVHKLGIVSPALRAGLGIEREQHLVLRAEIERVAHLDWGDLERGLARILRRRHVAGAKGPGDLEVADIVGRDLLQR